MLLFRRFIFFHFPSGSAGKVANGSCARLPDSLGSVKTCRYNALTPSGGVTQKGTRTLKQVILSMVVVAVAAGILAVTVVSTVSFLRRCERRILTGDLVYADRGAWIQMQ